MPSPYYLCNSGLTVDKVNFIIERQQLVTSHAPRPLPSMRRNLQGSNLVVEESPHREPVQRLITSAADVAVVHVRAHRHTQSFFASPEQRRPMNFHAALSRELRPKRRRRDTHLAWRTTTRFGAPFSQESSSLHKAHSLSKLGARPCGQPASLVFGSPGRPGDDRLNICELNAFMRAGIELGCMCG